VRRCRGGVSGRAGLSEDGVVALGNMGSLVTQIELAGAGRTQILGQAVGAKPI